MLGVELSSWTRDDDKLMRAVRRRVAASVQQLLDAKGINPTKLDPNKGITALHLAAAAGFTEIVDVFLGLAIDVDVRDVEGRTALHCAARQAHHDVTDRLLQSGSNVNAVDHDGWSALHHACLGGNINCVQLLIVYGASPVQKDKAGRTALMCAVSNGQASLCRLLLENGADVNETDSNSKTALMVAAANSNKLMCEYLIRNGAAVCCTDRQGRNALWYATAANCQEACKLLRRKMRTRAIISRGTAPIAEEQLSTTDDDGILSSPKVAVLMSAHELFGGDATVSLDEYAASSSDIIEPPEQFRQQQQAEIDRVISDTIFDSCEACERRLAELNNDSHLLHSQIGDLLSTTAVLTVIQRNLNSRCCRIRCYLRWVCIELLHLYDYLDAVRRDLTSNGSSPTFVRRVQLVVCFLESLVRLNETRTRLNGTEITKIFSDRSRTGSALASEGGDIEKQPPFPPPLDEMRHAVEQTLTDIETAGIFGIMAADLLASEATDSAFRRAPPVDAEDGSLVGDDKKQKSDVPEPISTHGLPETEPLESELATGKSNCEAALEEEMTDADSRADAVDEAGTSSAEPSTEEASVVTVVSADEDESADEQRSAVEEGNVISKYTIVCSATDNDIDRVEGLGTQQKSVDEEKTLAADSVHMADAARMLDNHPGIAEEVRRSGAKHELPEDRRSTVGECVEMFDSVEEASQKSADGELATAEKSMTKGPLVIRPTANVADESKEDQSPGRRLETVDVQRYTAPELKKEIEGGGICHYTLICAVDGTAEERQKTLQVKRQAEVADVSFVKAHTNIGKLPKVATGTAAGDQQHSQGFAAASQQTDADDINLISGDKTAQGRRTSASRIASLQSQLSEKCALVDKLSASLERANNRLDDQLMQFASTVFGIEAKYKSVIEILEARFNRLEKFVQAIPTYEDLGAAPADEQTWDDEDTGIDFSLSESLAELSRDTSLYSPGRYKAYFDRRDYDSEGDLLTTADIAVQTEVVTGSLDTVYSLSESKQKVMITQPSVAQDDIMTGDSRLKSEVTSIQKLYVDDLLEELAALDSNLREKTTLQVLSKDKRGRQPQANEHQALSPRTSQTKAETDTLESYESYCNENLRSAATVNANLHVSASSVPATSHTVAQVPATSARKDDGLIAKPVVAAAGFEVQFPDAAMETATTTSYSISHSEGSLAISRALQQHTLGQSDETNSCIATDQSSISPFRSSDEQEGLQQPYFDVDRENLAYSVQPTATPDIIASNNKGNNTGILYSVHSQPIHVETTANRRLPEQLRELCAMLRRGDYPGVVASANEGYFDSSDDLLFVVAQIRRLLAEKSMLEDRVRLLDDEVDTLVDELYRQERRTLPVIVEENNEEVEVLREAIAAKENELVGLRSALREHIALIENLRRRVVMLENAVRTRNELQERLSITEYELDELRQELAAQKIAESAATTAEHQPKDTSAKLRSMRTEMAELPPGNVKYDTEQCWTSETDETFEEVAESDQYADSDQQMISIQEQEPTLYKFVVVHADHAGSKDGGRHVKTNAAEGAQLDKYVPAIENVESMDPYRNQDRGINGRLIAMSTLSLQPSKTKLIPSDTDNSAATSYDAPSSYESLLNRVDILEHENETLVNEVKTLEMILQTEKLNKVTRDDGQRTESVKAVQLPEGEMSGAFSGDSVSRRLELHLAVKTHPDDKVVELSHVRSIIGQAATASTLEKGRPSAVCGSIVLQDSASLQQLSPLSVHTADEADDQLHLPPGADRSVFQHQYADCPAASSAAAEHHRTERIDATSTSRLLTTVTSMPTGRSTPLWSPPLYPPASSDLVRQMRVQNAKLEHFIDQLWGHLNRRQIVETTSALVTSHMSRHQSQLLRQSQDDQQPTMATAAASDKDEDTARAYRMSVRTGHGAPSGSAHGSTIDGSGEEGARAKSKPDSAVITELREQLKGRLNPALREALLNLLVYHEDQPK